MSTSIDTVYTDRMGASADGEPARSEPGDDGPVARRIVDVSALSPAEVRRYAREADCGIHFERKGGRTFLVAG